MELVLIILLCSLFALGKPDLEPEAGLLAIDLEEELLDCFDEYDIDPEKIVFWIWSTADHDRLIRLNQMTPTQINFNTKIIFLIHGWTNNITDARFPDMKDAYLQRYPDANIISIEWATYSNDLYINSYCYIPEISSLIAKFICNLKTNYGIDIRQLHLVGHSLGGQLSGLTGQETQFQCNQKIGRITGLDPAGPLYQMLPKSNRLDASDATIVDVIHTNQAQFGYYGACGTADFYPNCGYFQPGCLQIRLNTGLASPVETPTALLVCNHLRSIDYFIESILSKAFKGSSCKGCPGKPPDGTCIADTLNNSSAIMGEDFVNYPSTAAKYYLSTNAISPYAIS